MLLVSGDLEVSNTTDALVRIMHVRQWEMKLTVSGMAHWYSFSKSNDLGHTKTDLPM